MRINFSREFDRQYIRQFVEKYGLSRVEPGVRVLDAGSGNREEQMFRQAILERGAELVTCDANMNDGVDHAVDLHELPFADGEFDMLLNIQVLEHVRHPDQVCGEFFRVLKPGGIAIITVPQITHTLSAGTPPHYFNFTRHGLEACVTDAGFRVLAIEAQGGHFCAVATMLHYSVRVIESATLPTWFKTLSLPFCRVCLGLILKGVFKALDPIDRLPRSTLGWCICAQKL
jgi:SAM-dependent methyltransferase